MKKSKRKMKPESFYIQKFILDYLSRKYYTSSTDKTPSNYCESISILTELIPQYTVPKIEKSIGNLYLYGYIQYIDYKINDYIYITPIGLSNIYDY